MQIGPNCRRFLAGLSAAGAASVLGGGRALAGEAPPEVTTIRMGKIPGTCIAPQYLPDLLRVEGFTDVRYIPTQAGTEEATKIARGEIDFSTNFVAPLMISMDAGERLTMLAGVHPGCFELFGNQRIRTIADLKGKSVSLVGHKDFVRQYPVATKRALRATLKATDLCATDPAQAARQLVEGGFALRLTRQHSRR